MPIDPASELQEVDSQFCGLVWQPSNEQEVVALFFRMLEKLPRKFAVWQVGYGYPDCEAYEWQHGEWRKCRIEFEYKTSNFNHDPDGCDLIVCWVDDAPPKGCPPVLALKDVVKSLATNQYVQKCKSLHAKVTWDKRSLEDEFDRDRYPLEWALYQFFLACHATEQNLCVVQYGTGYEPCYTFKVSCGPVEATPVGTESPGYVYVSFDTCKRLGEDIVQGFQTRLERAPSFPHEAVSKAWPRFSLHTREDLIALEDGVAWLLGEVRRQVSQ